MVQRIINFMREHPSYFKRSVSSLAKRFKCTETSIRKALIQLEVEKKEYYISLKKVKRIKK